MQIHVVFFLVHCEIIDVLTIYSNQQTSQINHAQKKKQNKRNRKDKIKNAKQQIYIL